MPRLSFSLRDVFWLTLVAAVVAVMGVCWRLDRQYHVEEIRRLRSANTPGAWELWGRMQQANESRNAEPTWHDPDASSK